MPKLQGLLILELFNFFVLDSAKINPFKPGVPFVGHRNIGKRYSPRCDAAERGVSFGAILFADRKSIEKWSKI